MRQRLSSLALCLVLLGGNVAVCAGWAVTPEARMACCLDGGTCPMHEGGSHGAGAGRVLTQEQADACCARSERGQSSHAAPTFLAIVSSAVLGAGVVLPVPVPALVASDGWRTASPVPIGPVPRHVLLSVFLV